MKQNHWLGILVLFMLGGCVEHQVAIQSTTPSPLLIPQSVVSTSMPIPTQTAIPLPLVAPVALSAKEVKDLVFALLEDNGNCQLPCLWGLTPGKTDSQTLGKFLLQFDNLKTPDIYMDVADFGGIGGFFLGYRENNIHVNTDFFYYEDDEKKQVLLLGFHGYAMQEHGKDLDWLSLDVSPLYGDDSFNQAFKYYLLPQILSNYGRPSQVLLAPFLNDPDRPDIEWYPFSLVLLYPEDGIFVEYVMPRNKIEDKFVGCPSQATINLAVWESESGLPIEYVIQKGGAEINELNMEYFKPLAQATKMTLDEFYEIFQHPDNTTCLQTLMELWPGP
ncbi:MAG TPA: hypothetical protein PK530_05515 [Anaerolineales bacterium]|nr:hypothetical protein [Anaerolineales bacterium]